jgi:hypothetical protein
MSLSDALNELTNDLPNETDPVLENIATETMSFTAAKESKFKFDPKQFNPAVIEKFNKLYNVISTRKILSGSNLLDKRIAQEVFMMLPEVNKSETAKLTNYPSEMNKHVIEKVLNQVDDKVPSDSIELLREFLNEVRSNLEHMEQTRIFLKQLKENLKTEDERLNKIKPMVIANGESKNLYTTPLYALAYTDDTTFGYDKYEGTLTSQYSQLLEDETLKTFLDFYEMGDATSHMYDDKLSLYTLAYKLSNIITMIETSLLNLLDYVNRTEVIIKSETAEFNEALVTAMNDLKEQMYTVKHFKMLFDITEIENNFFYKLESLMKFLD